VDLPVIISDTFGRPWRRGLTDIAIGVSGLMAVVDLRGTADWVGRELHVTEVAVADEIASAADLVMGKSAGIPAAVVRGYEGPRGEGRGRDLIRSPEEDLFR
jgi:coenzyme F420-0:L-glutamate ligase/coenzyme F420-1:gamma-L-glutamate ligase